MSQPGMTLFGAIRFLILSVGGIYVVIIPALWHGLLNGILRGLAYEFHMFATTIHFASTHPVVLVPIVALAASQIIAAIRSHNV